MKQRFSSLDLQVISHELSQTLTGYRLSNIYDLTSRIFLFKFALPDSKHFVIVDSGFRCHLTSFTRQTSPTPSSFTSRLRKHLRSRRLTAITQLGVDRILHLTFSDGRYHVFLEFFAGGNVILTDAELTMLAVLRIVPSDENGKGACKVGLKYNAEGKARPGPVMRERVIAALEDAIEAGNVNDTTVIGKTGKNKNKKKASTILKRVLAMGLSEFSPVLIEHALLGTGVDPYLKADEALVSEVILEKVVDAFREVEGIVRDLVEGAGAKKGYIIAKHPSGPGQSAVAEAPHLGKKAVSFGSAEAVERVQGPENIQEEGEAKGLVFDDFHPFLPRQFVDVPGWKTVEYEGFNKTVDTFFSLIESQKLESRLEEREKAAAKRLESARIEHQKRVDTLRGVQDLNVRKAQALEANAGRVEEVVAAVNALLVQGVDWVAMARLIESEQQRGNAVAELIQLPMKLYDNSITLKLLEDEYDEDQDETGFDGFTDDEDENENEEEINSKKLLFIDINLSLSAHANARVYYDQKRTAAEKEIKTLKSSTKALKSAEQKVAADLKKGLKNEKQLLRPVRKPHWFEKFLFFISSDGYLILGGRDAQQNEHLYKRHFKRGDVYVHADIDGAASIIVKNNPSTPNAPIPPSTLQQAGTLAVATSKAWDTKAVLSAWWVGFDQVLKTAPTGEYLTTGLFMIRGKKNFLPPTQLILGYGVLWRVDEESKKKHVRHRAEEPKTEDEVNSTERAFTGKKGDNRTKAEEKPDAEGNDDDDDDDKEEEEEEGFPDAEVESDDEEFPDAKLESDNEKGLDSEAFPDSKLESYNEGENETARNPSNANSSGERANSPNAGTSTQEHKSNFNSSETTAFTNTSSCYLSAKQRRDLKKSKMLPAASTISTTSVKSHHESAPSPSPPPSLPSAPQKASKSAPLPRGKKSKQKRIAQKYVHQDPTDRHIALSLLGHKPSSTTTQSSSIAPAETPEARKARLREQHTRAQAAGLAAEAKRHQDEEGSGGEEDEILTTQLDALIPDPYEDDLLLDAIPVCAPWGAMGKFTYRVKIQPGAVKKGKAIREVWSKWIADGGGMRAPERALVKDWRESELAACVGVGKVKVLGTKDGDKAKGKAPRGSANKRGKGSKRL